MVALRNIIDTWNMIEKFGITNFVMDAKKVEITEEDYKKMMDGAKKKKIHPESVDIKWNNVWKRRFLRRSSNGTVRTGKWKGV